MLASLKALTDRVLAMHQGRITGELARSELTEQSVMNHVTGHCLRAA